MALFLSAGHGAGDPGACWKGFREHDEAVLWVQALARRLPKALVVPTGTLSSKVRWINERARRTDMAIEIHFNASTPTSKGAMTLYAPGSRRGEDAAGPLQEVLQDFFPPSLGIRKGYFRGDPKQPVLHFLKGTVCTALILEPEFVYHGDSIRLAREACCEELAYIMRAWL